VGSSVFGTNGVYEKLKRFKVHIKTRLPAPLKLYFAKFDIKDAFNTINQDLLLKVVNRLLTLVSNPFETPDLDNPAFLSSDVRIAGRVRDPAFCHLLPERGFSQGQAMRHCHGQGRVWSLPGVCTKGGCCPPQCGDES